MKLDHFQSVIGQFDISLLCLYTFEADTLNRKTRCAEVEHHVLLVRAICERVNRVHSLYKIYCFRSIVSRVS